MCSAVSGDYQMDLRRLRDASIDAAYVGSALSPEQVAGEEGFHLVPAARRRHACHTIRADGTSVMLTMQSTTHVFRTKADQICGFLLNPTDGGYQRWWPGTHLALHTIRSAPNHVGAVVYMDEFVGNRRVKMIGVVREATPGRRITWQLKKMVLLPVWVSLDFSDLHNGVTVTHTIRAGFSGIGRLLDPILRLYFSADFRKSMDEHMKVEFAKLGDMLAE